MKIFFLKLVLFCGIVSCVNFPSWAGKHEPESLVDITSKVVAHNLLKPSEPEKELEQIYSCMTVQLPQTLQLLLLKSLPFKKILIGLYHKANKEMERKTKAKTSCATELELIDSLRIISENFTSKLMPSSQGADQWQFYCSRKSFMLQDDAIIMDSFQEALQGPFSNLELSSRVLSRLDQTQFQALIYSPIIKKLTISRIKESTKTIKDLFITDDRDPKKRPFPALTHLSLSNTYAHEQALKLYDQDLFYLLQSPILQNLRGVDLSGNRISNMGLLAMTWCPSLRHITHLNLEDNILDHDGVVVLLQADSLQGLIDLNISGGKDYMPLTDKTAEILAQHPHFQKLKRFSIHTQSITDIGIRALALSPNFPELTYLDVNNEFFSNKGALEFATTSYTVITPLPKLRRLILTSCDSVDARYESGIEQISEETTYAEIKKARPRLKFDY
ncbi:MAG: hypothetical protein BGO67_13030 [Alphaproteobacteria bacterium 41-28]|nr:MAG: hypothetical protein BGO67_13030 [Alphaproteobacteria bacterium 41-28]